MKGGSEFIGNVQRNCGGWTAGLRRMCNGIAGEGDSEIADDRRYG